MSIPHPHLRKLFRRLQIFHNFLGDDLGLRQVFRVGQRAIFEPENSLLIGDLT